MSDLVLPGTIPGLLQRGSPVRTIGDGSVVGRIRASDGAVFLWEARKPRHADDVFLDLLDSTGRWHAVRWLDDRPITTLREAAPCGPVMLGEILDAARRGRDMETDRIGYLRDLVLRLAGVSDGR